MEGDSKFTLYWKTGDRDVVQGRTISEAMTLAGFGGGSMSALDWWAKGSNQDYEWNGDNWVKTNAPAKLVDEGA